jgi:hypothetical protein
MSDPFRDLLPWPEHVEPYPPMALDAAARHLGLPEGQDVREMMAHNRWTTGRRIGPDGHPGATGWALDRGLLIYAARRGGGHELRVTHKGLDRLRQMVMD